MPNDNETRLTKTKTVAKFIVGGSVAFTISRVLANNVTYDNKLQKAEAVVGCVTVGYLAGEAAETSIERKIDQIADWWDEVRNA